MNSSLNIHSDIKQTIESLSVQQLKLLMLDITLKIVCPADTFDPNPSSGLTMADATTLETPLSGNGWIYFQKWVVDLLLNKVNQQGQNNGLQIHSQKIQ